MTARPLQPSESEIQREVEVLRDLRRRSTTPGALTIDPDLPNQSPPVSPTAIWPGKPSSTFPISATDTASGSFAQGSSTLQRSSSSSSTTSRAPADAPNNPSDDPLHLFWVPASLHPEIAPAEFRAFLKEHARSPVDPSDSSSVSSSHSLSSSASLSRKKSMLSRQYRPKENDGVEHENVVPLKRNRSLLYPTNPGPQLTISDLQMLEELAEEASTSDDPSRLRNVLRRSLSLNLSPSAVEMMDEMPEMGDEADVPIIVPPPGQILRRAARTKIRKPGLPGDGGGHRFGASRRGGHSKPSPAAGEPRTSSEISSSDHGDSELGRRPTISDESSQNISRPESYSEEASIYDSYVRDDDEDTQYTTPAPVVVTPAPPEHLPIEESTVPQLPPVVPPVLYQPQPQRLNVPPTSESSTPSRTPSPSEPVIERPPPAVVQPPPPIPAPSSFSPPPPAPAATGTTSPPSRKEKEKKGLFKWGDKGSKKGSKERESRERAEKEKEKEKDSGFFGSLFGGKKKQDADYQSSMTGGTSGREAAQALLGASKSSKSYVPPTSPGLAPGIGGNPYARYPIHVERAIYRLSHIKLANPRRPLYEQVLISNLMFWYLGVINKAQNPTAANLALPAAANGQQPANSGAGAGGTEASEREQEEREQREREQREKEAREKAEKERLEREQREREMEQKKKENGRRGSLTKPPPTGGASGGRRAAEMPIKGPQYEMQHRVMEQEYGQGAYNGGGPPRSPTSPTNNGGPPQSFQRPPQAGPYNGAGGGPPRGPPEQQYYYQMPVDMHLQGHASLPPGAMPPVEPTGSWSGQQQPSQQRTSPPPSQQRRPSPNPAAQRRSQSPPTHHPHQNRPHHHQAAVQKQNLQQLNKLNTSQESLTLGPDGTRRPPGRSLSATAYSTPPAGQALLNGAALRKGNSANAAAPYDRQRERRPSTSEPRSPGGEEEDVPLAVWQQQRRK